MARKRGRPPIELDPEKVEALAAILCTDEEIAAVLGCSVDTIGRRKRDDPDFAEVLKRGRDKGKASLRRMQWQAAKGGNVTMMIWLGKQVLGQRNRSDVTSGEGPVQSGVLLAPALDAEDWMRRHGGEDSSSDG